MLTITKLVESPVVDFAAEELKKYLRMMMPRAGEIEILSAPGDETGFRLGLLETFGLSGEGVNNPALDDVLYIDTTADGGILAGSNVRSILLAVYCYLRKNGCRWLFPGIDGEYIPVRDVEPVSYRHAAAMRYRAQCNEGAESQQSVLDAIDFTPKLGMNTFMLEFDIPFTYYKKYYGHTHNPAREPEPVTPDTVLQWKRMSEAELSKRGLQFFDMGHGWTAESFGISSLKGWESLPDNPIPESSRQYLAMIDGKRELCHGVALNTNICMSNPDARRIVRDYVVKYAEKATNVHCLKISLADWQKNHCECENCRKMRPADWYVVLLNEIDEEFTRRGIPTKLGFTVYSDTTWEPEVERIRNPKRFAGTLAPISRSYLSSVPAYPQPESLTPYVRNVSARLDTLEEYVWHAHEWEKMAGIHLFVYEYHFWKAQFYFPSCLPLARRVHEDVHAYRNNDFVGMMEDCSQRNFFPNALAFSVYAQTMFDLETDCEAAIDDYFAHAYGEAAPIVKQFFEDLSGAFRAEYVEAIHSKPVNSAHYHDPAEIENLRRVAPLCDALDKALAPYRDMPFRVQTVAIRLLGFYTTYLRGMAQAFMLKAAGKDAEAKACFGDFFAEFGKNELAIERYYDQNLAYTAFSPIFKSGVPVEQ